MLPVLRCSSVVAGALLLCAVASSGCEKKASGSVLQGRDIFASTCARCHGAEGGGGLPAFAGGPAPRNFRDHAFQTQRTDQQLKLTIVNGKGTGMPPFGTAFTDAQLDELVRHLRSLDPETAKK